MHLFSMLHGAHGAFLRQRVPARVIRIIELYQHANRLPIAHVPASQSVLAQKDRARREIVSSTPSVDP